MRTLVAASHYGRRTEKLIDLEALLRTPEFAVAVYSCGPDVLLKAAEEESYTEPEDAPHIERFKPPSPDRREDTNTPG